MDASNAPQLTEAQAEAVLLMLGAKLAWEQVPEWPGLWLSQEVGQWLYFIRDHAGFSAYRLGPWNMENNRESMPQSKGSMAAAIAACERHCATGQWEAERQEQELGVRRDRSRHHEQVPK